MNSNDLAARVRRIRKERGLTQQELADRAGLPLRTYQSFESGETRRPQGETLAAILEAVGLTDEDNAVAAQTRSEWPLDVRVFLDMLGAFLTALPEERRMGIIHDVTRQVFNGNV